MMAEFGWGLSDELKKKALTELGEVPEQRVQCVAAVKEQIETRPDISELLILV